MEASITFKSIFDICNLLRLQLCLYFLDFKVITIYFRSFQILVYFGIFHYAYNTWGSSLFDLNIRVFRTYLYSESKERLTLIGRSFFTSSAFP
jgi:hypothetical protein